MPDLILRKVIHPQARDNYRVILKDDGDEIEIGSIGVKIFTSSDTAWTWSIDTVIPLRVHQSEGRGKDRKDLHGTVPRGLVSPLRRARLAR
jgi:hypothetical protein